LPPSTAPLDETVSHFGSWHAALAEIGLQPQVGNKLYERDELLDILRHLAEDLGHPPMVN